MDVWNERDETYYSQEEIRAGSRIKRKLVGICGNEKIVTEEKLEKVLSSYLKDGYVRKIIDFDGTLPLPKGRFLRIEKLNPISHPGQDRLYEIYVSEGNTDDLE